MTTPSSANGGVFREQLYVLVDDLIVKNIGWYQSHKAVARRLYRLSTCVTILMSALIPVLLALNNDVCRIAAGALGAVVATLTGLSSTFRWGQSWSIFTEAQRALESHLNQWKLAMLAAERLDAGPRESAMYDATDRLFKLAGTALSTESGEFFDALRLPDRFSRSARTAPTSMESA